MAPGADVVYCGVCGLPPEYCEFGRAYKKCSKWLADNHAELAARLGLAATSLSGGKGKKGGGEGGKAATEATGDGSKADGKADAEGAEEDGGADGGGEGAAAAPARTRLKGEMSDDLVDKDIVITRTGKVREKAAGQVVVKKMQRSKRKFVTVVVGLETVDVDLKEASRAFGRKFSCGASVVKQPYGSIDPQEIDIQGDVLYEVADFIIEKWGIDEDKVLVEETTKKGRSRPVPRKRQQ